MRIYLIQVALNAAVVADGSLVVAAVADADAHLRATQQLSSLVQISARFACGGRSQRWWSCHPFAQALVLIVVCKKEKMKKPEWKKKKKKKCCGGPEQRW